MGGFSTVTPSAQSATSVAQAVWSYTPRSLTDIQSLTAAIQNNDPSLLSTPSDLQYVPVPYYAGQVIADQVAAFIDNAIRNYNMAGAFAGFITNNPFNLWPPNAVGAFLSSLNMSQTSVALLLGLAGATQMAQALNSLSGNYTNVVNAFNAVSPTTGATVMANVNASQAATLLSHPVMSVTQVAMILGNSAMPAAQGASIINAMAVNTAAIILNIAAGYNATQVAMELNLLSTSELINIAMNSNMSFTSLAAILSNAGLSANNAQLVLYGLAQNYYYNRWVNTVTANAGSTTISTNVTVVNPLYSQNLTVASGVTVTCGTTTCFFVAQSFNNYGTILNKTGGAGTPGRSGGGSGGGGGGGIAVIAITAVVGTIEVPGSTGGGSFAASAGGNAPYAGGAGVFVVVSGVSIALGGTGAPGTGTNGGIPEPNGGGGGGGDEFSGGTGGASTLNVFSSGNALLTYMLYGIGDWWLRNVVGHAPATSTPLLYFYGSGGGGGGGCSASSQYGGGAGGGGGGEVIIYGYSVIAGTVDAYGGAGGTGGLDGSYIGGGGGGGGGGIILVFYGPGGLSGTMNYNVAPGGGGAGSTSSLNGLAGQTGVYFATSVTVNG